MPHFFVTVQFPNNFDPCLQDESVGEDIHALHLEMEAAGVKIIYACGLEPASNAKSLKPQPDGTVLISDGPYVEAKEYVGGFSILECADMDEALVWAKKGAAACRMPGDVRAIFFMPPPDESN